MGIILPKYITTPSGKKIEIDYRKVDIKLEENEDELFDELMKREDVQNEVVEYMRSGYSLDDAKHMVFFERSLYWHSASFI